MIKRMGFAAGASLALALGSGAAAQPAGTTNPGLRVDAEQMINRCIRPADRQRPFRSFTAAQRQRIVACLQAEAGRQLNLQLPASIDNVTRLVRVTTRGTELTYHYSLAVRRADLPAGVAGQLEASTRANVCAQPPMRQTMEYGGSYGYRWLDSAGLIVHQIHIAGC